MSLSSGSRLGVYEIVSLIGIGGMGEVYRARDTKLNRDVAFKVLPEALALDADRLARFAREAQILASLNHPNIAHIHGVEESSGIRALVLELVDGPTLADRIAQGPLPIGDVLGFARQIAEALDAAHTQGIVHRDLKPANIKLRSDGVVKVLDFGLAKARSKAVDLSQSPTLTSPAMMTGLGVILGTASYMSPEQARGSDVDKRADIWAFGCVLYEMLTGRPVFAGATVTDTLAAILEREPDWSALPSSTPSSIRTLLRRCLDKEARRRVADIADARLEIEDALAPTREVGRAHSELSVAAATGRGLEPSRESLRRHALWAAGGAATAAAIFLGVWALALDRNDRSSSRTTRFAVSFDAGQPFGVRGWLALSGDGQTLIFRAAGPDGVRRLYRRSMTEFDAAPIADTENGSSPLFSPDGRWLAFAVGTTLKKVSLSGGRSEIVAELPATPRGGSWETSDSIVLGAGTSGLLQVAVNGGTPTSLAPSRDGRSLSFPQVLPGRRAVLFTESRSVAPDSNTTVSEVQILELGTGRQRTLLEGSAGRYLSTGHLVFVRGETLWAVGFNLERLELSGTPMPVFDGGAGGIPTEFAVGADGTLAYLLAGAPPARRLVWVGRDGREESIAAPPRGYTYPRLSPDGTRVAIDTRDREIDIWIFDLGQRTLARLTFDPAEDEYPTWTPDGRAVMFSSYRDGSWGAFSQAADGTGAVTRVGTGAREIDPFSLSPDGRRLVLGDNGDLVTLDLKSSDEVSPLLVQPSAQQNAEISPDGRWLAYQSNESGRHEIYVRPFPLVDRGLWQVSTGGGTHPLWARNGRELFYLAPDGLMSVPVQANSGFLLGPAGIVLKDAAKSYWLSTVGRAYDVAPDGQRFLMLKEEERAAGKIHLVLNWQEELKRLLPGSR